MINVEIKNLSAIKKAFRQAPQISAREFHKAIKRMGDDVEREAKDRNVTNRTPVDTNILRNSILNRTIGLTATIRPHVSYADAVHEGTKPHWPPIKAIEPWARRHKISPFAVARAISKKGTKARPFMQWALDRAESGMDNHLNKAFDNIIKQIKRKAG